MLYYDGFVCKDVRGVFDRIRVIVNKTGKDTTLGNFNNNPDNKVMEVNYEEIPVYKVEEFKEGQCFFGLINDEEKMYIVLNGFMDNPDELVCYATPLVPTVQIVTLSKIDKNTNQWVTLKTNFDIEECDLMQEDLEDEDIIKFTDIKGNIVKSIIGGSVVDDFGIFIVYKSPDDELEIAGLGDTVAKFIEDRDGIIETIKRYTVNGLLK